MRSGEMVDAAGTVVAEHRGVAAYTIGQRKGLGVALGEPRFVTAIESLVSLTGATVLVAHHTNQASRAKGTKLTAASSRGVTSLTDGFRWAASMSVDDVDGFGDVCTVAPAKSNYSRRWEPVLLQRDDENLGALVALDGDDLARLEAARREADPKVQRAAARETRRDEQREREDAAVLEIVNAQPGIGSKAFRVAMRERFACSHAAADAALERAVNAGTVRREGKASTGYQHHAAIF